jgi:predicted transcriptional regulator
MKQNITISLDKQLIQKARVIAARRGSSVSRMLADELAQLVSDSERYEQSRIQAIADLERGMDLGAQKVSRDELHER